MNIHFRNMTIFTKILLGFILLLALAALMGGALFYSLRDVTGVLRRITERTAPSIRYPTRVKRHALLAILHAKSYLLLEKKEIHEQTMHDIREIYANLDRVDEVAGKYNDRALLRKSTDVCEAVEKYQKYYNRVVALLEENKSLEHKMRILGKRVNDLANTHTLDHKRLLEKTIANGVDQTKYMEGFSLCTEIEKETLEARGQEKNYILYKKQEYLDGLKEHIANLNKLYDEITKVDYVFEHQALMAETRKATDEYLAAAEKWVAKGNELSEILTRMHETGVKVRQTALAVQEAGWQEMDAAKKRAVLTSERASLTGILVAVLAIIMGVALAFFIARGIAGPIKGLSLAIAGIARGDLSRRVAVKTRDEVGQLAISFNTMVENLQNTMVSRDYFDNIIKSMIDTLIVVDAEAKIATVNPATCHLLGYREEELLGQPVSIIFAEEEEEEVRRVFQFFREPEKAEALDPQDTVRNRELTYKAKDGRLIPMSFNASILTDEAGNVTAVVAGAKDITDIKAAEAGIRRERNFSQNIITTIPDSLLVLDKDLRIKSVNLSFYNVFGLEPEKVIGARITDILGDEDRRLTARLTGVFGSEKMLEDFELRYQPVCVPACAGDTHADTQGTGRSEKLGERVFNIRARNIIIAEEEEEEEELVVIRDVTDWRRAEEKLKEYSQRLEEMVEERTRELKESQDRLVEAEKLRALGLMASGVAHEFNNLLAAILGNTQLLKMDLSGHEGKEKRELIDRSMGMLNTIERAASDGAETVRRIQEYTRTRKDRAHMPADLNDIIENAIEFLRPRWKDEADKKKIAINVRTYLSDIPPILGNDSELRQVMTNLIINSMDAMPDGGDITIRTHTVDENVKVTVEDTGIGISKENIGKVFDPFFSTKDYKGTGLGLSVSYGIVKRHGGKIELESVPGKGTTFILTFPAAYETEEKEEKKAPPRRVEKAKVLVIDDEETVRNVLFRMLSTMGHEVELACNGREGLALFHRAMESTPFGLVFTDLGMPEMNGWEVAGEVKKVRPTTPVALITGWGLEVDRDEMKRQGVDLIIPKPFNMEELAGLVVEAMLLEAGD